MISSNELRKQFLDFFGTRGHKIVASAPLVPGNDKTLLFTNAGMVQFKDVFLGLEKRDYTRAASSQRCVRAGGKHNDLENVGYTARHHTFFEMLGNFSFGDYFKEDAIRYAWAFLTEVLKLSKEKLWVTVFQDDDEAYAIWTQQIGIPVTRITRKDEKDNFWQMGDTGPCGPCSEIFYDHGDSVAGGPPGSRDEEGDRYVEIWNLVFMQYERAADGNLKPLPKPSVDTGMGLERIAAVVQGVHSNYAIDLFRNLIAAAAKFTACKELDNNSLKVIADHIRSCAFLVADGVLPSNEGRGYVLRRIIRRAIRHGHKLGQKQPFFYKLVPALVAEMGAAYPELQQNQAHIERVLESEEVRFAETLQQGMAILEDALNQRQGAQLSGDLVFKLYDTYGFPVDLTADIAREHQVSLDMGGFETEMQRQRTRARASNKFKVDMGDRVELVACTEFTGYQRLTQAARVVELIKESQVVEQVESGEQAWVVLDQTPFYAESGGQVGDRGFLRSEQAEFEVHDTQKQGAAIVHIGYVRRGQLTAGMSLEAEVDENLRQATVLNHSATHLLHAALREVLGSHVQQKGSLVNEHYLRFDFSHFQALTDDELLEIERRVNRQVRLNHAAEVRQMPIEAALKAGAMALFGEKYGDEVRVLSIGDFSTELCGGTHVQRAGDIGIFKITSESGIAAGVRRIEAVTGDNALRYIETLDNREQTLAGLLKTSRDKLPEKAAQLLERNKTLERELNQLKAQLAAQAGADIVRQAVKVSDMNVLVARLDHLDNQGLRELLDTLKGKLAPAAIVLAAVEGDAVRLVAGVSKSHSERIHAGKLVNHVAQQVGGKGGGRPDMAQAGGTRPDALSQALSSVVAWIEQNIS